jgi:hypothetical protein
LEKQLVELVEACAPYVAEPLQPLVELAERFGAKRVEALLSPRPHVDQTGVPKDAEVL